MTSDLDIYRTANVLICGHGEEAAVEAAMRAIGEVPGDLGGRETDAPPRERTLPERGDNLSKGSFGERLQRL